MLRTLAHGRAADDGSTIGGTQAMYSTILVILQASKWGEIGLTLSSGILFIWVKIGMIVLVHGPTPAWSYSIIYRMLG